MSEKVSSPSIAELEGKYLTFRLEQETYGLGILKVREINGLLSITHVPKAPDYVRGVVNLRGKIIPVIDLRLKFGMPFKPDSDLSCVIVLQIAKTGGVRDIGVVVDEVSEVVNIQAGEIELPPTFGTDVDVGFICGIGKIGQKVVLLLEVDKIFTSDELDSIRVAEY
jgi:purine-binding chemotaxis protein CheW